MHTSRLQAKLVMPGELLMGMFTPFGKKESALALAGQLSGLQCHPVHQKRCGFDPQSGSAQEATD